MLYIAEDQKDYLEHIADPLTDIHSKLRVIAKYGVDVDDVLDSLCNVTVNLYALAYQAQKDMEAYAQSILDHSQYAHHRES